MAPPNPTRPATDPTAFLGNRSAGKIITSVDHDCWPKNAMLNSTMASSTGVLVTKYATGIMAALNPSASLRDKLSVSPAFSNRLENQPPHRQPTPDAAYGIHA